jgi:fermentation-respiration switch protein FrsA (DUF1100 family)
VRHYGHYARKASTLRTRACRDNTLRKLHWIEGASHNDLYDKEQYVGPAVTKLTAFFTKNLASDTTPAEAASA